MPIGITNTTVIYETMINNIVNVTSYPELLININTDIFNGYLFFSLLIVLWIILYVASQELNNAPLINAMYSGAGVTIVSFFVRAIMIYVDGVEKGLLTDTQLWIFPVMTVILALINYMIKDS